MGFNIVGGPRGDFERGENEEDEIKAWEAYVAQPFPWVRTEFDILLTSGICSSASPFLFPAFKHIKTNTSYVDGGLLHNNPTFWAIEEYKKIWGGEIDTTLDILVSLGSGTFPSDGDFSREIVETSDKKESNWASFLLNSEITWRKFQSSEAYNPATHHRLNVAINWDCALDSSYKIPDLLETLEAVYESQDRETEYVGSLLRNKVKEISQLLVAKLFFFQPTRIVHDDDSEHQTFLGLEGKILCRLGKNEKALGILFERVDWFEVVDGFAPIFGRTVQKMAMEKNGFETALTIRPIHPGTPIQISVVMNGGGEFVAPVMISGFPREFSGKFSHGMPIPEISSAYPHQT